MSGRWIITRVKHHVPALSTPRGACDGRQMTVSSFAASTTGFPGNPQHLSLKVLMMATLWLARIISEMEGKGKGKRERFEKGRGLLCNLATGSDVKERPPLRLSVLTSVSNHKVSHVM